MTFENFQKRFHKKNTIDRYWNYLLSIAVIGIGVYFLYLLYYTDWYGIKTETTENIAPKWFINCFSGFFISLGLYGFWRIPKIYEFTKIESCHSNTDKELVINELISEFKLNKLEKGDQYHNFRYKRGFFRHYFYIYIFYDDNNIYLNAQQYDYRGYIDFGTSKRVTNKIKRKILEHLEI